MISIKNSPLYNDQMLFMFIYFLMIIIKNSPLYNDQMLFMFIYFLMIYNNIVFFLGGGGGKVTHNEVLFNICNYDQDVSENGRYTPTASDREGEGEHHTSL